MYMCMLWPVSCGGAGQIGRLLLGMGYRGRGEGGREGGG